MIKQFDRNVNIEEKWDAGDFSCFPFETNFVPRFSLFYWCILEYYSLYIFKN